MTTPLEHDYIGLTNSCSMRKISSSTENLKETELRLGLPGSESPERKSGSGYCLNSMNNLISGGKRGFCDAINGSSEKWVFGSQVEKSKEGTNKAQVVGWPPIRSFRKNTMASNSTKNGDEAEGKSGSGCLYVKVSMDGAPYLRKVDLQTYSNYMELSSALQKMFSCFTIGKCGENGVSEHDGMSESRLMDLLHGSEYVLTYEDKDGDWMLVGDVPWAMFASSCKRLRIMKGSEAIGLAPRAMEKCKNRS